MKDILFNYFLAGLFAWLLPLTTVQAQAQENESIVKVSGFGTIGASYNPSREFDFVRDLLQSSGVGYSKSVDFGVDSRLGLQITAKPNEQIEFTGQIVSRRALHQFKPEVTWAYLKYMPIDELDLRLGRLGFDVYPLADSRNVAYSYLWVRPPVDYFGNLIVNYVDGMDAVVRYPLGNFTGKFKFFFGQASEETSTDAPNVVFSLKGSKIAGAHLELQSQNWLARVGYTELVFANEFPNFEGILTSLRSPMLAMFAPNAPRLAQELQFKDKKMRYFAAGLMYDNGPFQAQWMASRIHSETLGFAPSNSSFLTLAYRLHQWTPYINFAQTAPIHVHPVVTGLPTQLDPSLYQLEMGIQSIAKATLSHQNTLSLGVRYALSPNSDLKFQIDRINNTNTLLIRSPQANWNGKGTIYTCTYNFVF